MEAKPKPLEDHKDWRFFTFQEHPTVHQKDLGKLVMRDMMISSKVRHQAESNEARSQQT